MKKWVIRMVYVCVLGWLAAAVQSGSALATEEDATFREMESYVLDYLTEHDIPSELAEGILKYQGGDFYLWFQFDKTELNRRLNFILRVADDPQLVDELEQFPELTNLFVGIMACPDPDAVENLLASVRNLSTSEQRDVYGLLAVCPTPEEACELARLLRVPKYRNRILKLWRHSPANLELIPYFHLVQAEWKKSPQSAAAFEEWIFQIMGKHMSTDENDPRVMEAWYILVSLSEPVRENLRDAGFRERFPSEIWPAVVRVLDKVAEEHKDEIYEDPETKKKFTITYEDRLAVCLFTLGDSMNFFRVFPDKSVPLFEKVGANAAAILLDRAFYNPEDPNNAVQKSARERLAELLLHGREANEDGINVPYAILTIPPAAYGELRTFLNKKGLSNEAIQVGIATLANCEEKEVFDKLVYWNGLTTKTLMKEEPFDSMTFNPLSWIPGYDICAFVGKTCDGRRVTGGDILWAGIDVVTLSTDVFIAIATGGTGNMGLRCLKSGAKSGTKYFSQKAAIELAEAIVKTGGKFTSETLKLCSQSTVSEFLRLSRRLTLCAYKSIESSFDITYFVRSLFQYSKLGCKTFKKLTGLDARIFMRSDRRISAIIQWDKLGKNITFDVGLNAAFDLAVNTEVGQDAIAAVIEKFQKVKKYMSEEDLWKANLSSWWGICRKMDGKR